MPVKTRAGFAEWRLTVAVQIANLQATIAP